MAKSFKSAQGKAAGSGYKFKEGDNNLRMVGDVLPRYGYWLGSGKDTRFFECLAFDRNAEAFLRKEHDPMMDFYPEKTCSWSYVSYAFDLTKPDDEPILVNWKKKLFGQIQVTSEDLGDPTDPDTGWNISFKKAKTGNNKFDVEYTLQPLRCKPCPLTDKQKEMVAKMKPIDEAVPRPTVEELTRQIQAFANKDEQLPEGMDGDSGEGVDDVPQ